MEEGTGISSVICLVSSTAGHIDEFARRYYSFVDNHDEIENTSRDCEYVREELQKLDETLRERRAEIVDDLQVHFRAQIAYIEEAFKLAKENIEQLKLWFPDEKSSSVFARLERLKVKLQQFFCANSYVARIDALAEDIFDAKTAVSQLSSFVQEPQRPFHGLQGDAGAVGNGVKAVTDDLAYGPEDVRNPGATVARLNSDVRNVGATVTRPNSDARNAGAGFVTVERKTRAGMSGLRDNFRATFEVPILPSDVVLDFGTCQQEEVLTMEGTLKHRVMTNDSMSDEPGAMTAALGAHGMGGIGKTSALIGLGWDPEVRDAFEEGGIYFIYIGRDAQQEHVIKELARVVQAAGGLKSSKDIGDAASLRVAVGLTVAFFEGRRTLFLCDDIWETHDSGIGYLGELKHLLATHQQSGLVISTRNRYIASTNGSIPVTFAPVTPEGDRSLDMFLSYTRAEVSKQDIDQSPPECRQALSQVLSRCAGVPLTLAIAGSAVFMMTPYEDYPWFQAVVNYAQDLEHVGISNLIKEEFNIYPNFVSTVRTSLQIADRWAENRELRTPEGEDVCCSQLFTAMAVLRPQSSVSHVMLRKLWRLSDDSLVHMIVNKLGDLNLVSTHRGTGEKDAIGLHDLVLEYCQLQAGKRLGKYHSDLLNEYFQCESDVMTSIPVTTAEYLQFQPVDENTFLRAWWAATVDGYIHENVCRHLAAGGYTSELVALLSHSKWTEFRITYSRPSAWEGDFEHFFLSLRRNAPTGSEYNTKSVLDGLKLVRDSVKDAWAFIKTNPKELAFQMHARLCDPPYEMYTVTSYLESTRAIAEKPWLKPVRRYWPLPGKASGTEMFREGPVSGISLTNDMVLAAVAVGSEVLLCNMDTRTILQRLRGHDCQFKSLAMSQDGMCIASVSNDGAMLMWNRGSTATFSVPSLLSRDDQSTCVAMTRDGSLVLSGSRGGSVKYWDVGNGNVVTELGKHDGPVTAVAVSEDGKYIASSSRDGEVRLWDRVSGNQRCSLLRDSDSFVSCLAMSADGSRVASGSYDNTVQLWDGENGTLLCEPMCGHASPVRCVAMTADGARIVSGADDNTLRVWDGRSGQALALLRKHGGCVSAVGISPDGLSIVSGSRDSSIRLWNLEKEAPEREGRKGHRDSVLCVAISADGSQIASGSKDKTVRLWNGENGEAVCGALRGHDGPVMCVAFSADGSLVVSGSDDRSIRIWDWKGRREICEPLYGHRGGVTCVAANEDGRYVVSGARDGTLRLWALENTEFSTAQLHGHKKWVSCVAISPDGSLIVSGSRDRTVRLWQASTRRTVGSPVIFNAASIWIRDGLVFARHRSFAAEELGTRCWQVNEEEGLLQCDEVPCSSVAAESRMEAELDGMTEEVSDDMEEFGRREEELDCQEEEFDGAGEEVEETSKKPNTAAEEPSAKDDEPDAIAHGPDATAETFGAMVEKPDTTMAKPDGTEVELDITAEGIDISAEELNISAEGLDTDSEVLETAAEVLDTTAEGLDTTAEGLDTTAEGLDTTAEGLGTAAEGLDTLAEVLDTTAEEPDAPAEELSAASEEFRDTEEEANVVSVSGSRSEDPPTLSWKSTSEDDVLHNRPARLGIDFVKQYSFVSCVQQIVIGGRTASDEGVTLATLPASLGASIVEQDAWFFHPTDSNGPGGVLAVGLRDGTVCILELVS